jgi:hypothetical protein
MPHLCKVFTVARWEDGPLAAAPEADLAQDEHEVLLVETDGAQLGAAQADALLLAFEREVALVESRWAPQDLAAGSDRARPAVACPGEGAPAARRGRRARTASYR